MESKDIAQPIFGDWYVEEKLGSGAFGTVYKIKREDFGQIYYSALKVINIPQNEGDIKQVRSELDDDQSVSDYYLNFAKDFSKEIELMAELKGNSNIVSFEDHKVIQNEDGISWTIMIRMELLTPFVDFQSKNELSVDDIVKLGIDMCCALEICERRNIIHRDIKPDNIFVSKEGNYKLGDFGIARELEKTMGVLSRKGTYTYMAPEVYTNLPYDHTVDIYSLGIVLYRLLNHNRAPFLPKYPKTITYSDRENALSMRIKGEPIPDIDDIPSALNNIVKKACAFVPDERYKNATELKNDLINFLNGNFDPISSVQDDVGKKRIVKSDEKDVSESKKIPKNFVIVIVAALLILAIVIIAATGNNDDDPVNGNNPSQIVADEESTDDSTQDAAIEEDENETDKSAGSTTAVSDISTKTTSKATTQTTTQTTTKATTETTVKTATEITTETTIEPEIETAPEPEVETTPVPEMTSEPEVEDVDESKYEEDIVGVSDEISASDDNEMDQDSIEDEFEE